MKALIMVDIQNDFLPGGALPIKEGNQIIPIVNRLQEYFPLILATKDWHPADHGSFAANHSGKHPGDIINLAGLQQVLWPVHCVQGTPGAEFASGLKTDRIAQVFYKGIDKMIDSYGTFYDNGRRRFTGLDAFLREKSVTDLYMVGLATDYCVKYSVLEGIDLGFSMDVIIDACRGIDLNKGDVELAIKEMRDAGANIITSVDMVKAE